MRSKILICLIGLISTALLYNEVNAYSTGVHRGLTERTIDLNLQSINNYLKNIGLLKGVIESVNNREARKWIEDGSYDEDYNWGAWNNLLYSHFYNPLTNKSGVGDSWLSAYDWANDISNSWSWKKARDNFYDGLTLTKKIDREKSLAKAFKALGQVIHLVQDVGVPAHVRGNLHVSDPYEKYVNKNTNPSSYTSIPFQYWNVSISPYAPKQFWDLDSYDGSIPYGSGYIGLAEYTNANFASSDTIFSETLLNFDKLYFPFPRKSSAILYEEPNLQGKKTKYFKIIKESENIDHFAVAGRFYNIFEGWPNLQRLLISLDDKCHYDYAQKLIPRAVGYSAGLLNYFFRGDIEAVDPWAIQGPSGEITGAKFKVKNKTPNESMVGGMFVIVYQYSLPENDNLLYGQSNSVRMYYETIKSGEETKSELSFDFLNPIPKGAKDIKYWLVYRGKLGREEEAVIGKAINLKIFPSAGVIQKMRGMNEIIISIITKEKTAAYYVEIPQNERMVKAAFDEGDVRTVRILSRRDEQGENIWQLYTFIYDSNTNSYVQDKKEEVSRVVTSQVNREVFNFTRVTPIVGGSTTTEYEGILTDEILNSLNVNDFFMVNGQPFFLELRSETHAFGPPSLTFVSSKSISEIYNEPLKRTCRKRSDFTLSFIDGDSCYKPCSYSYSFTDSCDESKNQSRSGSGEQCQYSSCWGWWGCNAGWHTYSTVIVGNSTFLKFKDYVKEFNKYGDKNTSWVSTSDGPCLPIDSPDMPPGLSATGTILSDDKIVVRYNGYKNGILTDDILIEPDKIPLDKMPFMRLRQSGEYSFAYLVTDPERKIMNKSSFTNIPQDKPILLNKEGNGIKIKEIQGDDSYGKVIFYIGVGYNESTKDFDKLAVSVGSDLTVLLDVMVEYVNE